MGGSSIQYMPPSQQAAQAAAISQGVDLNADANAQYMRTQMEKRRAMAMDPNRNRAAGPPQRSMAGMMGSVRGNANPTAQYIPPPNVSGQAQQYQAPPPQAQRGPTAEQIQAEMQRRQVGAQVGANPRNAAISGYMMGK
jgi:hypothetical protein